jgi:DeoR/GlpR family transcriptional regulator of sugar metabolism
MEKQDLILRNRGSAQIKEVNRPSTNIYHDEKNRIAVAAAKYLESGMSVALDSGTSVGTLVDYLLTSPTVTNLQIITHCPQTALKAAQKFDVSIPGGAIIPNADYMVGLEVEDFYHKSNVDVAFLGSTGVYNCPGLTVSYPLQLSVKRCCADCADMRIALLDSSKFIRRGIYPFCDFSNLDVLITVKTDENAAQLERISNLGVEIVLV